MRVVFVFIFVFLFCVTEAQEKVSFTASDGLKITADLYEVNSEKPYILLFHQAGYSRGEYRQIADKIIKFGYNCLAVDLRAGGEVNYIQNHTALLAIQQGFPADYLSSRKDIEASIKWVTERSEEPVVLFGSSFSASLCLLVAKTNPDVKAVIAFSPGEFFAPELNIQSELKGFEKPVFAASSERENEYVDKMLSFVPSVNKTIFAPQKGGEHGSKSLWRSNSNNQEYWLALTMFFSKIR
ncbi:MAG: dienelactone hydrolase family protein [Bacteroidales bacterium]|nr:dienelactone hydrolase family protein [Bacteroidales bacterium]